MISEAEAAKVYGRNTQVIRKGDAGWTSDNHHAGRQGDSYGTNPLSKMDQKIRAMSSYDVDTSDMPPAADCELGDLVTLPHGNDLVVFRCAEREIVHDGEARVSRYWKRAYVEKNGALK